MKALSKAAWYGTKQQYLALDSIDANKNYYITDLAAFGITNAEMQLALTSEASLYAPGSVYICKDTGVYNQGHIYMFTRDNNLISWTDISAQSSAAFTTGDASLQFTSDTNVDAAYLTNNKNLYIGNENKDLSLDCNTFQVFASDGWNWESYITNNSEEDSARFTFQFGNISLSNSNQAIHLNKTSNQIIFQAGALRSNDSTCTLGTSANPWNAIYGTTIYQNGAQVANKADVILYRHNISLNGTNTAGYQINARVIAFNRNNTSISTYNQLTSITSESVDYPINGYVYSSDNTLLGTLIYYNHTGTDSLEFTIASANSIEVIELAAAQCIISDTVVLVE